MKNAAHLPSSYRVTLRAAWFMPRFWPVWIGLGLLRATLTLPLSIRAFLGDRLGDLYYRINAKRRRIALINLRLCFPEWTPEYRLQVLRTHFRLAARTVFHMAILWWASERDLDAYLTIRGLEHYEQARATGHNIVVLHGHCLALEASLVLSRYFPYVGFMKHLSNPVLDWAMTRGRERFGGRVFDRSTGLRPLIRAIKEGFGASYVPDEDLGPTDSVYAPFFGVPAATLPTLGRIAMATDAVVLPCFARFLPNGRCELWIEPPLIDFPSADPLLNATRMNAAIEHAVRLMPEQYLWTMKRFKTREDGISPYD